MKDFLKDQVDCLYLRIAATNSFTPAVITLGSYFRNPSTEGISAFSVMAVVVSTAAVAAVKLSRNELSFPGKALVVRSTPNTATFQI